MADLAEAQPDDSAPESEHASVRLDPGATEYYLNRELTWLDFNFRILREAVDEVCVA